MAADKSGQDVKNLGLVSLGSVLEYFDFQVYVFVAAAISIAFFPPGASPWLAQVQVFGIYALGYLVRPIAGMVIAHYADRLGRKRMFVFTVLLMSIPTFLMGLLPTYAMIGWLAPALLLLLRVLQGSAVGGELPGASVFVSEVAPPGRLGLFSGIFEGVVNCGLLLGSGAAVLAGLIAASNPEWGSFAWRLPFVLGGMMGLMAAWLRRRMQETPLFEKLQRDRAISRQTPLAVVIRDYRGQCVFALAMVFVFACMSGVYFQFLPVYLIRTLHYNSGVALTASTVGTVAFVSGMPLWGMLRDRIGWSATLVAGALVNGCIAIWFFGYVADLAPNDMSLVLAYVVVGLGGGYMHAMIPCLISSLFPTAIRQSGFAFPYSIGTAVFTGLTPITLAWLAGSLGLHAPLFQYLAGCVVALVLAVTVWFLPQHLGKGTVGDTAHVEAGAVNLVGRALD
jgi:MFS family permease